MYCFVSAAIRQLLLRCSTSGIHAVAIAAPLRAFPARAAMLGTANGAGIHESVHPWTASVQTFKARQIFRKSNTSERLLLRQDAA